MSYTAVKTLPVMPHTAEENRWKTAWASSMKQGLISYAARWMEPGFLCFGKGR